MLLPTASVPHHAFLPNPVNVRVTKTLLLTATGRDRHLVPRLHEDAGTSNSKSGEDGRVAPLVIPRQIVGCYDRQVVIVGPICVPAMLLSHSVP